MICFQVKAFGLNRMDIMQREGRYPLPPGVSSILGVEFSGVISEVGSDITEWEVGEQVLGLAGGVRIDSAYPMHMTACSTYLVCYPTGRICGIYCCRFN